MYRFLAVLLVIVAPTFALAQQAATLVADRVSVSPSGQLSASGNVEVFFDGTRMTASQVIYDQASDTLDIAGPIVIQTAGGDVFLADQAQLDPKLEAGLLVSARLVLNDQLQLAAAEIEHTAGTTTRMPQVHEPVQESSRLWCQMRYVIIREKVSRILHLHDQLAS